jgi:hypothetical protein
LRHLTLTVLLKLGRASRESISLGDSRGFTILGLVVLFHEAYVCSRK